MSFGLHSNVCTPNIEFVEGIMVKPLAMRYLGGRCLMKGSEFIIHSSCVPGARPASLKLLLSDKSDAAKHTLSFCINTIFSHLPICPLRTHRPENQGKGGIVPYAICRVIQSMNVKTQPNPHTKPYLALSRFMINITKNFIR